jgi:hypothetical protein
VHAATEPEVLVVAAGRLETIRVVKAFRVAISGRKHQCDLRTLGYSDTAVRFGSIWTGDS